MLRRIVRWIFRRRRRACIPLAHREPGDFAGLPVPYNPHPNQRTFDFEGGGDR